MIQNNPETPKHKRKVQVSLNSGYLEQVNVKSWSGASNAYIECIYKVSAFTNGSSPFSVGAIYINLTAAMLVYFSVNIERKILQQSSIVFYKY